MTTDRPTVLIVEDEESFVEALSVGLQREGFVPRVARDGLSAVNMFEESQPDIVLLDLMLPGMSGIDVCRHIRRVSSTPVIMVTARDTELDTVVGLELGADDYVTKPYRLRELVARMRAVMRRHQTSSSEEFDEDVMELGDIRLDAARREVTVAGDVVGLTRKEFELLEMLMSNAGRVITRERLIDEVWGADYVGDTKTLDVHIRRLRTKVDTDPAKPSHITAVRGVGYRYELPDKRGEA
jgi:two-component system response regulator RegX3